MAQTSGFYPMLKVKACFDCKMFDVANWVVRLSREDFPGRTPSHEALSVQGALEISPVVGQPPFLVKHHFSSPIVVAKPCKLDEGRGPSPQRPQYPNLTDTSNEGWGAHLEQVSAKVCGQTGKKATHKCPRVEGGISGPEKVQEPVPVLVATDNSTIVAYINKQGGTY